MALLDQQGRWIALNAALCALLGHSERDLLGRDLRAVMHPEEREAHLASLQEVLLGERVSYESDFRLLHREGKVVWVHLTVSQLRSGEREPRRLIAQIADISARHHAEAEAQLFFECSLDLLAIASASGRFERVNAAWERALGWSRAELTSRPYLDFVHPDDRDPTIREAEGVATGRPALGFRNRFVARDGSYRWLEWASQPTEDGKIFAVARDVTQQIAVESELRVRKRALAAVQNGVVLTDPWAPDHPVVYCNPAFERITGYTRDEIVGRNCRLLQREDRDQPALVEVRAAIREGRECQVTLRNYRKSGELFLSRLAIAPVRDASGRMTHFVGVVEDITKRVQNENAVREQAAILRAVLDSMNEAVVVADVYGHPLLCNSSAQELIGKDSTEIPLESMSEEFGMFLSDQTTRCPADATPLARALRGESVDQFELYVRTPAVPSGRWQSVTANPVRDTNGRMLGAVTVSRDMTARKRLEEEIRQASLVDELTELHNRRGFMLLGDQQLSAAARYGRPLLLLFADLDGLKSINDELGHQQGDLALTDTAEVLRATFRRSDIIARLGGDEFVVLAEGDEQFGGIMQRRIEERLHVHNATAWRPYELSLSIGMAVFKPGTGATLSELLALADKQMYQRKREARHAQQLPRRYSGFEATLRHSEGAPALEEAGPMWAPERRTRKP